MRASAYAFTVLLSAFLLFELQPIIGRMVLPWFGGSATVWTICVLFFQALPLLRRGSVVLLALTFVAALAYRPMVMARESW